MSFFSHKVTLVIRDSKGKRISSTKLAKADYARIEELAALSCTDVSTYVCNVIRHAVQDADM